MATADELAAQLAGQIVVACVEAGGSITGEHGVGVDKKRYMPKMFSEADLDAFQKLRCAFDPDGLANPSKVMPTPRLCGEVPGPYREHPLEKAGCSEVRVARDEAERQVFWKMRKAAFPAMGRVSSHYYVQDSVIPRTALAEVLDRIDELAREYRLQVGNVFHAGDGNLHPLVCYDGHAEGEAERAEELAGEIVIACVEAGGSITGEHGVGVDKKRYMPKMFDEPDLAAFQHLRCAFDPRGLANPGKVMPTPRLCGEVPGPYRRHPLERDGIAERF